MAKSKHQSSGSALRADLLRVYLNDHLAAVTGTVRLAERVARAQRGKPLSRDLDLLAAQIDEGREALLDVMRRLAIPARRSASWLGKASERAGRLKPNGHVLRRTPLTTLTELEALRLGVLHQAQAWRTLTELAEYDPRLNEQDMARLQRDAEHHATTVANAQHTASALFTRAS